MDYTEDVRRRGTRLTCLECLFASLGFLGLASWEFSIGRLAVLLNLDWKSWHVSFSGKRHNLPDDASVASPKTKHTTLVSHVKAVIISSRELSHRNQQFEGRKCFVWPLLFKALPRAASCDRGLKVES